MDTNDVGLKCALPNFNVMKNVAVICGGYSEELVVSMKSGDTIFQAIDTTLFRPFMVVITETEWKVEMNGEVFSVDKNDFSFTVKGEKILFDFAYITIHGTPGEDGKLQGYFDMVNIPYNTPNHTVTAVTFNKWYCNQVVKQLDIPCANSVILRDNNVFDSAQVTTEIGFPCFVKPNDGGSSFGISKVTEIEQLEEAINLAFEHGEEVMVESEMVGPEVTCGAYFDGDKVITFPLTEIVTENDFFDYEAKYEGKSNEITPARISEELTTEIQANTKYLYQQMGMSGIIRIDYIVTENGPYVIEINTVPGMSAESIVPQQVAASGVELSEVLTTVIKEAINN